jgi:steroid 5-alpha reductase family enzyme
MQYQPAVSGLVVAGVVVWVLGFVCESIADSQLRQFLKANTKKDALLTTGLWKYSRHPNYFGEVTQWWGIALVALSSPFGWVGLIGALAITTLICFVSGIPPAERRAASKPGWAAYKRATSPLVPLPPR